jgi:DNA-binding GntR family transcriptional regulator
MKAIHGREVMVTGEDIVRLRSTLRLNPRDLLFFELAIQTGLYAKDLLQLKVSDLEGLKPGQELNTGKAHPAVGRSAMTSSIRRAFLAHVRKRGLSGSDYLFPSRKGGRPLTLISMSRLASSWFNAAGLPDLHGALTLRRIWACHMSTDDLTPGRPIPDGAAPSRAAIPSLSLRDSIFNELQREIVCGRMAPGQRIFIENIALRMEVSAIPVREAFAMLAACGFLRSDKKRGYLVNELSVANLKEILELRLLLESKAAEQAAVKRSERALVWIEECHRNFVSARAQRDVEGIFRTNRNFHSAIYHEADMPILKSHIDQAWYRVSPYYHIIFRQLEKPLPIRGIHNHERIIEGIRNKNARETCKWVKEDLKDNARFVIEVIHNQQKGMAGRDA